MADGLADLFAAIRQACSAHTWSRGVELARSGAVSGESDDGDEITLRISERGGLISPTAVLFLDDEEWDCDCGTVEEVCVHVAGAVIALKRARSEGLSMPKGDDSAGRIGYRLTRVGGGLHFERVVVGAKEATLRATLAAVSSGRADGPAFVATQEDLRVERVLGAARHGALPRGLWQKLIPALEGCRDVTLDGEPVRTTAERAGWVAVLEDQEAGFFLRVKRDPRVHETFTDQVALLEGGTLCLVGAANLTGREKESYERGRSFTADQVALLVSEVLPSLADRVRIEIRTDRLPKAEREPPIIAVEAQQRGETLEVMATLVYGDPPRARVDAGKLVPLGGALPLRDEEAERALARQIQQDLELAPGRRLQVSGEEAVRLADRIRDLGFEVQGGGLEGFRETRSLEPSLDLTPDAFGVRFTSEVDGEAREADASRVFEAFAAGQSLVPLLGGGFAPLPKDWLRRYGTILQDLLAARDDSGTIARAALPDLAKLYAALDEPLPLDVAKIQALADAAEQPKEAPLPEDLTAELRHYQQEGVDWLVQRREAGLGALLADDMGLGKTLQMLCALEGRTLVVAPTSVLHNWAAEIRRFRPALRCAIYHGPGRKLAPDADVVLTSYAILRLDLETLQATAWDTLVLDESQAIKNPQSQSARAAFALNGRFRVALTGTPVENRLEELWSQIHFVNPGLLGGRRDFDERYGKPIAAGDGDAAARLRARIAPFILRRTKREVAPELPPRTDIVLHAELRPEERAVYDALLAATRDDVITRLSAGGSTFQALEALLRLRQAACHRGLVPGQNAEGSSKVDLLLEVLEEAVDEGHKALVFSQWTSLLDRVEPALGAAGIPFSRLDGATRDRAGVVDGFQRDDGPPVLLLSLKAGGTGLNLTAADHVFILDPWWNPAAEDQAADRAHRIGQDKPVLVQRLVAKDTVEERILELQRHKRELAAAALEGSASGEALTREEILDLLG